MPRYCLPGQPQHVIQRGNNRNIIFAADDDYQFYRDCLQRACEKQGCAIHAYVLMTNHVHLLMTPERENAIGKVLQSVGRRYVQYFNHAYQRTGTLWEGRYKATLIDTEAYLLTCYRYIEINPVRAGMVASPGNYRWSSYACNVLGRSDCLVEPHELYHALGRNAEERRLAYRALFKEKLDEATLTDIREATNKAWVLGNERFKDEIEKALQRRTRPLARGGDRRSESFLQAKD
jgi:putative transposase